MEALATIGIIALCILVFLIIYGCIWVILSIFTMTEKINNHYKWHSESFDHHRTKLYALNDQVSELELRINGLQERLDNL